MPILYQHEARVVTITIDRPDAMNAIDPETHHDLIDAWIRFRDDPDAWVAILTGAGEKAFSAGADLKKMIPQAFAGGSGDGRSTRGRGHNDYGLGGITRGLEIWKPMIAAVNGYALAGGLEQVLACDLRVAAEHATFGLTEVRWAIMPGAGGTQRLPRTIPLARAMELILTAETISAPEAYRLGLVNAVVPLADVMPTARRWAQTICERGPLAVRAAKEAVIRGLSLPLADGLRLEALLSGTLRGTEDAVEGPKAFAEKRKPVFKAR
jgi:E-phenylitaconyl-CoA hydratase